MFSNRTKNPTAAGSQRVDQALVERYAANPDNPYLISFPRTGSHWLRMMIELYFERPTLVRNFYFPERTNYLLCHHHDVDLEVERRNVLYLYRDPVATVYSQLRYDNEPVSDKDRIAHWSTVYGKHLDKWLVQERFTTVKTVLTYEGLKENLEREFSKVTAHFGETLAAERLQRAAAQVTKGEVKSKTAHDRQVVQLDQGYETSREAFRERSTEVVWESVFKARNQLRPFFEGAAQTPPVQHP
ncbi:MAG: sulfotransferase domain-containing protein [bacterium]